MWWVQAVLTGLVPALVGGFVGLVLGNLRWPLVLALVGGSATLAAGTNVAVSTVSAVGGTYKHAREGRIDRSLFLTLGGAAIVGGLLGSFLTRAAPAALLLWFITVLLLHEGARMVRAAGASSRAPKPDAGSCRRRIGVELLVGFGIGVLSGMVGMLLGSLRLPAMIRWLGVDARRAVGTNMAIGLAQGLAAAAGHLAQGQVALLPLAVVGLAALLGSYVGAHFTGRLPVPILKRAIGVVVLVAGLTVGALAWRA
ncbi:MAG: sulfite exporter TauE/SafE family protein [Terriglobia bacterium]